MHRKTRRKKIAVNDAANSRWVPALFALLALLVIVLPLQGVVNSARAMLSYVFIPQLRAAHALNSYIGGVNASIRDLLSTAARNSALEAEITELKIQNAQNQALEQENARLLAALQLPRRGKWAGTWAKVAYREPSRRSTVIVDRGSADGIELRAPVIGVEGSVVGLIGKVVEVTPSTAKVLFSSDGEFSVTAFLSGSRVEALAMGDGVNAMTLKYVPLQTPLEAGEKVYTSASSVIFPDGILIGEILPPTAEPTAEQVFLSPRLNPAVEPLRVKEVLILKAAPAAGQMQAQQGGGN